MTTSRNKVRSLAVWALLTLASTWVLTVHSQSQLQVGYATLTADANSYLPVASALFAFRNSA